MLLGIIYSMNTSIKSSNLLKTFWNIHPPKLANPTRSKPGQPLKQNIKKWYSDAVIPNKKILFCLRTAYK